MHVPSTSSGLRGQLPTQQFLNASSSLQVSNLRSQILMVRDVPEADAPPMGTRRLFIRGSPVALSLSLSR